MPLNYFFIVSLSFALSLCCIFLLMKSAARSALPKPSGLPVTAGLGIALSFSMASLYGIIFLPAFSLRISGILVSSLAMFIFGLIDDWRELSVGAKFMVQILATCILISFGVKTQIVYIGKALNILVTFVWVIGITNAINHLDILDGLAGGVAAICAAAFFVIAVFNADIATAFVSLALLGAVLGFLAYNLPPARIYMGNAGSHFLGFLLGAISICLSYATLENKIALLAPLLILGFPIFDTIFLILIRTGKKKIPFKKSNDHLALRFLRLGHSKRAALYMMLLWALVFSSCGVLLSRLPNMVGNSMVAVLLAVGAWLAFRMSKVCIDG